MSKIRIQYASDLHLEFSDNWCYLKNHPLEVAGEVLVLAGDIGYLGDESYRAHPFWDQVSESYEQVVVCMGNHEFYKGFDVAKLHDGFCHQIRPNVRSYYNSVIQMGDVDIIVTTLWAYVKPEDAYFTELAVTDFKRIVYEGEIMTFAEFNKEHKGCLTFLKDALEKSNARKRIVVTHHVPSFKLQNPRFAESRVNGAFVVELHDFIENQAIDYWIFGHSHYNIDLRIGDTLCTSNQLGYVFHNEHYSFQPGKYVEL
jgi:predicted phosphodiesterase